MKDILLVTNYWHFETEKASSRYLSLAKMIADSGMKLEVITSTFYHATKGHREYDETFLNSFPYKVTLIHESGYAKNISIKRLLSHREFANNVIHYIKNRKKPDVIYCVVPSLDVAHVVTKYANKNGIKVIVDIQDLWPEAFRMVFNVPGIRDLIFTPIKYKANKIYAAADEIVAVSQSYVDRALKVNKKCDKGHSVYLGVELPSFDRHATNQKLSKNDGVIYIAYTGTLGYSYDLISVFDAIKKLNNRAINNIKFIVMGEGPLRKKFEDYARKQNINVEFTGRLEYGEMVKTLSICDIAVNPIVKNSAASIINKHADYAAAGLPILNTQESFEFRSLLTLYNAGFNCVNNNSSDLAEKLLLLIENIELRERMGKNSRILAENKFNRLLTYREIIELISKG